MQENHNASHQVSLGRLPLTQASGYFQRTLVFSPQPPPPFRPVRTPYAPTLGAHVSACARGVGLSLETGMQGLLTRATGKKVTDSRAARPLLKQEKRETRQVPRGEAQRQTSSPNSTTTHSLPEGRGGTTHGEATDKRTSNTENSHDTGRTDCR